jgi:hypothetical protein
VAQDGLGENRRAHQRDQHHDQAHDEGDPALQGVVSVLARRAWVVSLPA